MARKKLARFLEVSQYPFYYDLMKDRTESESDRVNQISRLQRLISNNGQEVVLELGCGSADLSVGLAKINRQRLYVALDIQGERLWRAGQRIIEEQITNLTLVRGNVRELGEYFAPNTVDQIWLTFPDPQPKKRNAKHRLTHPRFLDIYREILRPGGEVILKTDSTELYQYSLEQLEVSPDWEIIKEVVDIDLVSQQSLPQGSRIETYFEAKARDKGGGIGMIVTIH
ncbi:tRNA (guanosine(46)-N7)-methyltransferase TrmB [Candidatus Saccharibacteria bacterium]|nr:tRNA (guanosine(46)-N7)-methyltransferase TrmB [Candidatus Saccharibacteria bacterium]